MAFSWKDKREERLFTSQIPSHFFLAQLTSYEITLENYKPKAKVLITLWSWIITGMAILYRWGKRDDSLWICAPPLPLTSWATLYKFLHCSEPYPLQNVDNTTHFAGLLHRLKEVTQVSS